MTNDLARLTLDLPDGTRISAGFPYVPTRPESPHTPDRLRVGMSYKTRDRSLLADYPNARPAFRRLFMGPGHGMPKLDNADAESTPDDTVHWWSHKDAPDARAITLIWTELARRFPAPAVLRWTFQHEANDLPWEAHVSGWKTLKALQDVHPDGDRFRLSGLIGGYYARFKSLGGWRRWVLPEYMDEIGFDLYSRPEGYEAPESLLGLPVAAKKEFGLPVTIGELGSPLLGNDSGVHRSMWLDDCLSYANISGIAAVGLWNSHEKRDEKTYDYRFRDQATIDVVNKWLNVAGIR